MDDPDPVRQSDAALVLAYTAGDTSALAAIYDRYADRLFDVAAAMMRDRHEAADVMQDTFLVAAERMGQLRDPERLKPWLFSIARHEIYRRTKKRSRTVLTDFGAPGVADVAAAVDPAAEGESVAYAELAELVRSAASGLDERDEMVLELSVRQGLQGADLAAALGLSAEQSYTVVHRARERVERSLGALVVARSGRKDCPELAEILRSWDGTFSILIRKRVARHVENCSTCERTKRKVAPLVLLGDAAALAAPPDLRDIVLAKAAAGGAPNRTNDYDFGNEGGFPRAVTSAARKIGVGLGIVAAALLVSLGGAVAVSRLTSPDRVQLQSATATTDSLASLTTTTSNAAEATTAPATTADATATTTFATDTTTNSSLADTTVVASTNASATSTIDATTIDPTVSTAAPVVTITHVPLVTVPPTTTTHPPRPTVPPTTAAATTVAPTTTPPTTAPPTTAAPTTAPPTTVPPGRLQASSGVIDLGAARSAGSVTLTNVGGQTVSYALGSGTLTPFSVTGGGTGTLAPGQGATVTITLARRGLAEGTYSRAMGFVANGVTTTVQLNARVEIPPTVRIATPARDGSVCQATPPFVGAVATDSSGIAGVTLSWVAPNGDAGSTPMTLSATSGQWTGSIRLERSAGIWTYTVTATDTRGNSAAVSSTFSVVDCIG